MPGFEQTIIPFLTRAEKFYPEKEIVTRTNDRIHRYSYSEAVERISQLANALQYAGVSRRDRLGTFSFNHFRHFEIYFGVPGIGAQYHTINPFLPDKHIEHIVKDAEDKWIFIDPSLLEKLERALSTETASSIERFVVMGDSIPETSLDPVIDYESLIGGHPTHYEWPQLDENLPASMCYTSGTTGMPKGVEYTHKMMWSHSMACLTPQGYGVDDSDTIMSGVPMFHVNSNDSPFFGAAAGAKQVLVGESPDPKDYVSLIQEEDVTLSFAVPTICLGIIEYIEENDLDLPSFERIQMGADSVSQNLIRRFEDQGIEVLHGWGMTEALPLCTASRPKPKMNDWDQPRKLNKKTKIGVPLPGVETKVVNNDGNEVPWDGESFGELYVRGPWITTEYFNRPAENEASFKGKWLKTGDIVTVDEEGYFDLIDRNKYLIKSGGEWISSMQLEKAIESHDHVITAGVIGVPDAKWGERPVAYIVCDSDRRGKQISDSLRNQISAEFPDWWTPDEFIYVNNLPETATGKIDKEELENRYQQR
ncbi:long-chain-fatty-acid--CoA ligase [Halobellus captivus]|uniref:long-chain-fatty-acid--CoA ligase n=1 Tax=Halobellus captivus TaxID=2592614 RepID=UPI0011A08A37|nr:long-chain-fatty-acid--CoA ligase [Halobellus captivus]